MAVFTPRGFNLWVKYLSKDVNTLNLTAMKNIISLLLFALFSTHAFAQISDDLYRNTPAAGVVSSGKLPDLTAYNMDGEAMMLRELCKDRYTLLIMGCLTCPEFKRAYPAMECLNADNSEMGVQFLCVYKKLRHPELDGYVEAQNISERVMMVERIEQQLGGKIPWIIDDMDDNISETLRSGSRSVYLVSPSGKIVNGWARGDEQELRQALNKAVGTPKRITTAEELHLPELQRAKRRNNIQTDTSIERGDGLYIVKTTPHDTEQIHYVKMRAEAEPTLLEQGTGRLALGFFPDPLYDAHWNNLATPMKYTMSLPEGVSATPSAASAKQGRGDSDSEPRQFWVDIDGATPGDKIDITYHYFACAPGICLALSHTYTIEITPEGKGASTYGFNRGKRGANRGGERRGNGKNRENAQNRERNRANTQNSTQSASGYQFYDRSATKDISTNEQSNWSNSNNNSRR